MTSQRQPKAATATEASRPFGDEEVQIHPVHMIEEERLVYMKTDPKTGLTQQEAAERLEKFGRNEMIVTKPSSWKKFFGYFTEPIAILIEVAAIFSAIVEDWTDFGIILALLIMNAVIGYMEEAKAESALDALQKTLSLRTKVIRDGRVQEMESALLVPGDIVSVRIGDIVPADCKLLGLTLTFTQCREALMLDEAALTGESLPVSKHRDDIIFSSSICKQGQMLAIVVKTGGDTFIGRAANLINITHDQSHFQIIVGRLGYFLIIITVVLVVLIYIVKAATQQYPLGESKSANIYLALLKQVVVLTVAALPVGLPTVLSVTMAVGAKQLSAKNVIVKRLTAIEELSSVSILCSDKTGTLTLNELSFDKPFLAKCAQDPSRNYEYDEMLLYAYLASEHIPSEPIELTIHREAKILSKYLRPENFINHGSSVTGFEVQEFYPFNPDTKMTRAIIRKTADGSIFKVAKGAPQVILKLVGGHPEAEKAVLDLAKTGLRALGVAYSSGGMDDNSPWHLVGMLSLFDPPRPDSKQTIAETKALGVEVKMITGDQLPIAKEVAKRLGLFQNILDANSLNDKYIGDQELIRRCEHADGFAQVVPEHKFRVVELLQHGGNRLIGMTGDGVNDAPALKKANVGIAVHGCTDAARSASDIVLLAPGLSTIVDGIKTSRAIFQRMRSYALYRISSTIHFLLFFFITILAFNWSLPPTQIILIALLNDAATLVISVDNAQISKKPDKWRMGQLLFLSMLLGILLTISSFLLFFVARFGFGSSRDLEEGEDLLHLQTIMYLQISSCPHFMIFGTRLPGNWWENRPSPLFMVSIIGTQIFAMFISIYGIPSVTAPIGWAWGVCIMLYSTLCFMLFDMVKVYVIRHWSLELVAKMWPSKAVNRKLEHRRRMSVHDDRYRHAMKKVRAVKNLIAAAKYWQNHETRQHYDNNRDDGKLKTSIIAENNVELKTAV